MATQKKEMKQCLCEKCGHEWINRLDKEPSICPACKSERWNFSNLPKRRMTKKDKNSSSANALSERNEGQTENPSPIQTSKADLKPIPEPIEEELLEVEEEHLDEDDNNASKGKEMPSNNPDDYDFMCSKCKELFNREGNVTSEGKIKCPDCKEEFEE